LILLTSSLSVTIITVSIITVSMLPEVAL